MAKAYLGVPLSIFLLLNTLAVLVYNGYRLSLEDTPSASVSRTADLLGLNQRWNLFAPKAPKQCYILYAVAELTDGSQQFLSFWREAVRGPQHGRSSGQRSLESILAESV